MSWFRREENQIVDRGEKTVRTEGLWTKCDACSQVIWRADLEANLMVCPKCGYHFKMDARTRIAMLLEGAADFHLRRLQSLMETSGGYGANGGPARVQPERHRWCEG